MIRVLRIFLTFALVVGVFGIWGFVIEPGMLFTRHETMNWPGPDAKIIFFSDLHAGAPHVKTDYIAKLVERINAENPDLVLIGGDLAITHLPMGVPMPVSEVAAQIGKIKAKYGVFAVLGNHDHWNAPVEIREELEKNGIQVMDNRSKMMDLAGFKFWLVGVADDFTRQADLKIAFKDVNTQDPQMLFMHDPGILMDIQQNYMLALAGHLHGGQIALPFFGALVKTGRGLKEWASGWTQLKHGPLFVTRGIGTSILPVRINAPPEFVVLTLSHDK